MLLEGPEKGSQNVHVHAQVFRRHSQAVEMHFMGIAEQRLALPLRRRLVQRSRLAELKCKCCTVDLTNTLI